MTGKESYVGGASQGNVSFDYDLANRLRSMDGTTYSNDSAGNRTGKIGADSWGYIYDGENQLTQVNKNGVDVLDNMFDGSGMRVKEVKGGLTTYFVYQGNNPILEYTPSDGKYKYFIYAGNKMVAEETDGVVKYYHTDHLGSTRLVTDAAGSKVVEYKFKAFGERESYSGSFQTEYQFTGKPGIDEVGLSYFGARFYDPEVGRFLTADTYTNLPNDERILLGTGDSKRILATGFSNSSYYNRYAYCLNNPIGNVDPDGHIVPALIYGGIILAPYVMAELPSIILFVNRYGPLALDLIEKGSVALCFTEDTPVYTKNGYKFIKDIKVGDDVYSENPETGEKGLKKVVQVFVNETQTLVHIFVGNAEIKATPSHPFWVVGKGWIDAGKLITGDNLLLYSGEVAKVTAINIEQLMEPIKVYNFEVEDWHNYFVSRSYILVHNACGSNQRGLGGKGWVGDPNWRQAVNAVGNVSKNTTILSINGYIPTKDEAIALIEAAGGKIVRIDDAHEEGGVSTHTFDHINYTTADGKRATIQIQSAD